jgi:hypothetical protein
MERNESEVGANLPELPGSGRPLRASSDDNHPKARGLLWVQEARAGAVQNPPVVPGGFMRLP